MLFNFIGLVVMIEFMVKGDMFKDMFGKEVV